MILFTTVNYYVDQYFKGNRGGFIFFANIYID